MDSILLNIFNTLCISVALIVFDTVEEKNRGQKLSSKFANRAPIANFLEPCQQTEITKKSEKSVFTRNKVVIYVNV